VMNRDDPGAIRERVSELQRLSQGLAELLARAHAEAGRAGEAGAAGAGGAPHVAEGEVIDAEPIEK